MWKWFYRVRQRLCSWVNNWSHATSHRRLMVFMKWKKTQMRQLFYQKKHALFLLQDGMLESVNPFHFKGHSTFTVRTCVFKTVQMKNLTLSLLSPVYLPGESPSHSIPFCCTASAPYAELSLSLWVCSVKLGSTSQKQLFVLYPCAFIKKCVSTHTLFIA